jgi:type VI secretion system protein VasG
MTADRGKEVDIGARQVDHILNQQVLPGLSQQLLEQMATETMPKSVRMGVNPEGNFTYTFAS